MTKIKHYVDRIDEEIEDAKYYAEKSVECKSKGNLKKAEIYNTMSNDELQHAENLHQFCVEEIADLEKVFRPTKAMQDMWDNSHKEYVERVAWVKTMLSM